MKKRVYLLLQSLLLIVLAGLLVIYQDKAVTLSFILLAIFTIIKGFFKFIILPMKSN